MSRKITNGTVGRAILGSLTTVNNSLQSVVTNANVLLEPNGTGIVQSTRDLQVNAQNSLRLADADSSNFVALRAPTTVSTNVTYTFPAAAVINTVLRTDASGVLSWVAPFVAVANQTADTATYYPTLTTATSGTASTVSVSNTKLTYQPSTGRLSATEMRATASTASSSTTTGALVVSGGAGVAGALYAGGAVRFTQNTASTSTTTGTLVVTGGIGLNGRLTASNIVANGATSTMRAINPEANNTYDLGTTALRWRNIYTQDLHLSNGIGDYTVIEGEEDLFLVNNKNGKSYKFALVEVNSADVPPKSEVN